MALTQTGRIEPPVVQQPIGSDGVHTRPWVDYHQAVSDALAGMRTGTVLGDNARAGQIGEYIEMVFPDAPLTSGVALTLGSMALTAGDWDVSGGATFTSSTGTLHVVQTWVGAVVAVTPYRPALIATPASVMVTGTALWAGPVRVVQATAGAAELAVLATFTSGTGSASGFLVARRVR